MTDKKDPYFTFYVCDHFETGCGRTIFIMIDCGWDKYKMYENMRNFVGDHPYFHIDELSEEVFMERYGDYLSDKIKKFLEEKDTSFFTFQQKLHFSYS